MSKRRFSEKSKTPTIRRVAGYGWIPDLPDHRDTLFAHVRVAAKDLPASVDLRINCSPVEDQGQLGSCTANALAGAVEFLEMKDQTTFVDASRLFIYYNERVLEHTADTDSGAMLRDGIKTLAKQGVCSETLWPYRTQDFALKPNARSYADGLERRISTYSRLETLDDMRACLAAGFPFVFGFTVYESFESPAVAKSGIVPMPRPGEGVLGGHAVMAVGYDDKTKRFVIRNSWGPSWGMRGYCEMPYSYLVDRNFSDDFWTIRSGAEM